MGVARAPAACAQTLGALGLRGERGVEHLQRRADLDECLRKAGDAQRLGPGETQRRFAERKAQVARRAFQPIAQCLQLGRAATGHAQLAARVARELQQLRGGEAVAEEKTRRFGQLVRLVEDERIARGQELGHTFVPQHDVGEE